MIIWPQIVIIAFMVINCSMALVNHGEYSKVNLIAYVIGSLITAYILYCGGFWNVLLQ